VQHHHHAGLLTAEAERDPVHLHRALGGAGQPELPARHPTHPGRPALAQERVEIGVADHLQERLALAPGGPETEQGAGPLVHENDMVAPVDGDHAFHHAVQDGAHLGLLLLESLQPLPEAQGHGIEGAPQRADLVGRAHRRPDGEVALAHFARHGLHLHHRLGHPARHEESDAAGHAQGHQRPDQHHLVQRPVRGRHHRERQGQPQHAEGAGPVLHRQGQVEQGHVDGGAAPEIAAHLTGQGGPHLGPAGVVFDPRQRVGDHLGVTQHPAVRGDESHPGTAGAGHARDERLDLGRAGASAKQGPGLVLEQAAGHGQLRLERLHRQPLQGLVEVQARGQNRHGHEPDQGEGELDRDPTAEQVEEASHVSPCRGGNPGP
jgi:hypothetical protein